jgi:hypothetical protein
LVEGLSMQISIFKCSATFSPISNYVCLTVLPASMALPADHHPRKRSLINILMEELPMLSLEKWDLTTISEGIIDAKSSP